MNNELALLNGEDGGKSDSNSMEKLQNYWKHFSEGQDGMADYIFIFGRSHF